MGTLSEAGETLGCAMCSRSYRVANGIPIFVDPTAAAHDELDHLMGNHVDHGGHSDGEEHAHKAAQSAFFDRADMAQFEIERPVGSPAMYRFLLTEKFRRSLRPLGDRIDGWTALAVCGGSGMDAEFLEAAGASAVISADISLGAAERARQRAIRHGLSMRPIVADVEHLPFADRSVDLVYVHDGLHHLEDPATGLREMARVARRAVCITEPAEAALTSIGVRLGIALDREEAGNRVARFEAQPTKAALEASGFRVVEARRYAMYYRHVPGRMMKLLSRGPLFPVATHAWRIANGVVGRFGNKLTVVAVR